MDSLLDSKKVDISALVKKGCFPANSAEEIKELFDRYTENLTSKLIKKGYLISENYFEELAGQLHVPYVDTEKLTQNRNLAAAFPHRVLKRNNAFPVFIDKEKITMATSDPFSHRLVSDISEVFPDHDIEIGVANPEDISAELHRIYKLTHTGQARTELLFRKPRESCFRVLTQSQRFFLFAAVILFIGYHIVNFPAALIVTFGVINLVYVIANATKMYATVKSSAGTNQIKVTDEEVAAIKDEELPNYTIIVPAYQEAETLPVLLENLQNIDYPREKLDIKIVLEEGDMETLEVAKRLNLHKGLKDGPKKAACLWEYEILIAPRSTIRTKPRVLNYGLKKARGDFCVVYDVEDRPEPDQLKKAICAFKKLPEDYVCLQSRLGYFNIYDNLLTRWFTLEYVSWFDYYLPGLQSVKCPIPLGGTSNHFKIDALIKLGAWDPYNVTEDADLGVRIFREGKKTGMLNTHTYEEANNELWNWIRQRSRWLKGFILTYFVHMRNPFKLLKQLGLKSFLMFQIAFGGNFMVPLLNPILWVTMIAWLLVPQYVPQLIGGKVMWWICFGNLAVGNLFYIGIHFISAFKANKKSLAIFALFMPIYWILLSVGAYRGLYQVFTKPFLWEKTNHGLAKEYHNGNNNKED